MAENSSKTAKDSLVKDSPVKKVAPKKTAPKKETATQPVVVKETPSTKTTTKVPAKTAESPAAKSAASVKTTKTNVAHGFVRVYRTGSSIGRPQDQHATLLGLGLRRTHAERVLEKTPSVMGMIRKVRHLVRYEDVGDKS